MKTTKLACLLCTICRSKHPSTFAKVVEGSEIYNFAYYLVGHFSSKFWSYTLSNRASLNYFGAWITSTRTHVAGTPRRPAAVRRHTCTPRPGCDPRSEVSTTGTVGRGGDVHARRGRCHAALAHRSCPPPAVHRPPLAARLRALATPCRHVMPCRCLTGKPTKGVPEVVDCAVGMVIERPRT
jgi:hypothetical protein